MPTIIVLDTSVSMMRPFPTTDGDSISLLQLAQAGINYFLDYLSAHEKLEFVAFATFSSVCDTYVNFTRDYDSIRTKLAKVEEGDEAHIQEAIAGVSKLVLSEWGPSPSILCNVVLFTDGSPANASHTSLPFSFPAKLHIISMSAPPSSSVAVFNRLSKLAGPTPGSVLHPEPGPLSTAIITALVKVFAESTYTSYLGILKCGNLTANIGLYPAPEAHTTISDGETHTHTFSEVIEVYGFIDFASLSSPMSVSRHLVTPLPTGKHEKLKSEEGEEELEDGRIPSFCVLFHGALKVENAAALCRVGENWFGVLYSWADSKKKSNLMLTVFVPGADAVPWFSNFFYIGAGEDFHVSAANTPSFPVQAAQKPSFSQNAAVTWIRKAGLQADIQKVLRHAKKLPDKTTQFYKELNKLRRAAVCFGFIELLEGLAAILERECQTLPSGIHPDCALQLDHVVNVLRQPNCRDPKTVIYPIPTRYQTDHD